MKFFFRFLDKTNYCSSLHSPAKLPNIDLEIDLGLDRGLDKCCRFYHLCEIPRKVEFNQSDWTIGHCKCEKQFRICLKRLNSESSNAFGFIRWMNTTKCYTKSQPPIKCVKFESFLMPNAEFYGYPNAIVKNSIRCLQYELDPNKPKQFQLFDLPFYYNGLTDEEIRNIEKGREIFEKFRILYPQHELHPDEMVEAVQRDTESREIDAMNTI